MIEVELCSQLSRSDGLSDPDSQVVVSGQTVDWLEPSMPGLMRPTLYQYYPVYTHHYCWLLSLPNCSQAGSGSAESQPEVAIKEQFVKVLPVGEEKTPHSFK